MSYRILLVEDDPDSRALVGDILRDADLEVDLAEDLAGAVERQDLIGFDAVIADYELPDGTGLDLCRHIQEVDRELPVLLLTSHAKLAVAVEALRAGAYDFLTKPIEEPAVLLRAVSRACQDRELRHELRRIQDHEDETLDAWACSAGWPRSTPTS